MKTERLTIKILSSDKVALQKIARDEGEAIAVVVRKMLRESIERRGLLPVNVQAMQRNETLVGVMANATA